jgi:hypothetical protein
VVEVRVALVPLDAGAPVAGAVGGVDALAVGAPTGIVRRVALGGAAAADVPHSPVEHDGHGEIAGAVEVRAVAVLEAEPVGVHEEHVVARRCVAGEGRVPLPPLEVVDLVRLEEVDAGRYLALAAPHAGARPRDGVLGRPAHGHAPADVVARHVDEVAEAGAAEREEAVLCRGEEVGAGAEGHVRVGPVDQAPRGVVAHARGVVVNLSLAGGKGQAGDLVAVAVYAEAGRGVVGVVADELEALYAVVAETAGADAEGVGDGDVAAPGAGGCA